MSRAAREFLDKITRLAIASAMLLGFTTGIGDEDIPSEAKDRIAEVLDEARGKVEKLIEVYNAGELEPLPGRSLRETLEMRVMEVLAESRDIAGSIAEKYLGLDNHAVIMARIGARGSMLNLTQMAACVGQQSVRGERISRGYRGRTLPHYKRGDLGAGARGFVSSSYKSGLKPLEFFFHAMGGREGLVDTAVRTAQSGYLQRRLINALQDLRVEYDGTVRDDREAIVQFSYGEDGADPARSDKGESVNVRKIVARLTSD
jgi:DNA-directed RNA polymerase subunit A'